MRRLVGLFVLLIGLIGAACAPDEDPRPASFTYIWAAIIQPNCTTSGCHSAHTATFGLQLDSKNGAYLFLTAGSVMGENQTTLPANYVVPGDPLRSRLLYLLRGDETFRMPPDGPLPDPDIALIERWIAQTEKFRKEAQLQRKEP